MITLRNVLVMSWSVAVTAVTQPPVELATCRARLAFGGGHR